MLFYYCYSNLVISVKRWLVSSVIKTNIRIKASQFCCKFVKKSIIMDLKNCRLKCATPIDRRGSVATSVALKFTFYRILVEIGPILKRGGGVQARKVWKQFIEITVDPKGPPSGPIFWSGLQAPDPLMPSWRQRPFSRQK